MTTGSDLTEGHEGSIAVRGRGGQATSNAGLWARVARLSTSGVLKRAGLAGRAALSDGALADLGVGQDVAAALAGGHLQGPVQLGIHLLRPASRPDVGGLKRSAK